jgi:putative ABC transport system substrate-binding protein
VAEAATAEEYERAFARFKSEGVNGVVLLADPSNILLADRISEVAFEARLPTASQLRETVRAGGLMSYGASNNDQFRLAAFYVDRILRGQKPADLPVQQPTMFEFWINLKTAKLLGVTVPDTVIALADEVVE